MCVLAQSFFVRQNLTITIQENKKKEKLKIITRKSILEKNVLGNVVKIDGIIRFYCNYFL